ncbi:SH3 domain-binding glutamic acid-rich protein homolog [Helicoverpa zea]|uniref:SH3 domain-binding glutamic acid-rich protein homolog n=1 Tax=Helicoverpa zea TaxID=7113 RepID=UPI001F5AFAAD|nr:SH3 domain-binding glutamic acid-rich protein homolog [Helicoverpa zea]
MVVKVYISGISGNKEVKKRQQRVLMILDSKNIKYDVIDITEPGKESDKEFMQNNSKSNGGTVSDPNPRSPLPPQIFNDDEYCGDYDQFDLANEVDTLEIFLKMEAPPEEPPQTESEQEKAVNGDAEAETKESEASIEDKADTTEAGDAKEKTPEKEGSPAKEASPSREEGDKASKEGTPAKDEEEGAEGDTKEKSPERQKSVDKEATEEEKAASPEKEVEVEAKKASKESSPAKEEVNENGTVSSREHSQEKDAPSTETETAEVKKDNPSEALIQSEQVAAAE